MIPMSQDWVRQVVFLGTSLVRGVAAHCADAWRVAWSRSTVFRATKRRSACYFRVRDRLRVRGLEQLREVKRKVAEQSVHFLPKA